MSDHDKDLITTDNQIPLARHVFCTDHLARNIRQFSGAAWKAFNSHVRHVSTEAAYHLGMQKLAAVSTAAANYVDGKLEKSTWAAPFLRGKRPQYFQYCCGHLVPERKMAIIDCLQSIWNRS